MALPSLTKTWQFDINNINYDTGTTETTNDNLLLAVKNAILAMPATAWTTYYSCSSTVAGAAGDGVDRWSTITNIVHSATTRSWYVLASPAGYQVCLDMNSTTTNNGTIVLSPSAGFTGGTTSARPTATDEIVIASATALFSSAVTTSWHLMKSSDGEELRVVFCTNGVAHSVWMFGKAASAVTGWTNPYFGAVYAASVTTNAPTLAAFNDLATRCLGRYSATNMNLYLTCEGWALNPGGENQLSYNDVTGEWPFYPIGLASETAGAVGRHGRVSDLWWGSIARNSGDSYPEVATFYQFVQFGNMIFPWDSATAPVTS